MADEQIRELQRRWETTGDPQDGLRYAREAFRQEAPLEGLPAPVGALLLDMWREDGRLSSEQLRLAALAGLPAARELLVVESRDREWVNQALTLRSLAPAFYRSWFARLARRVSNLIGLPLPDPRVLPALLEALDAHVASPSDEAVARIIARLEPLISWHQDGLLDDLAWEQGEDEEGARAAVGAVITLLGLCQAVCFSHEEGGRTDMQDPAWSLDSPLNQQAVLEAARAAALELALRAESDQISTRTIPYSARGRYRVGEKLAHPKFGEGEVVRVTAKQVHVTFAEGVRKLAQGLGP